MKNGKAVTFPIDSPKSTDSGVYQCFAYNSDSWISKTTEVIVTGMCSFLQSPHPNPLTPSGHGALANALIAFVLPYSLETHTFHNSRFILNLLTHLYLHRGLIVDAICAI